MQKLLEMIDQATPVARPVRKAYVIAIASSAVAMLVTFTTHHFLGTTVPFLFGLGAVMVSAAMGGLGPALLATTLEMSGGLMLLQARQEGVTTIDAVMISVFCACIAVAGYFVRRLCDREAAQRLQLANREAYLTSIFAELPSAILVLDREGSVMASNRAARRMFGVLPELPMSANIRDFLTIATGDLPDAIAERIARQDRSGKLTEGRSRDGRRLLLSLTVARMESPIGDLFALQLNDETMTVENARKVSELQAEMSQLGRAAALGAMGSAIAHELNQPLASAANYAGAARKFLSKETHDRKSQAAETALGAAQEQIFRASAVIKGLRNFVQPSSSHQQWQDVRPLVEEAARLASFTLKERGAHLTLSCDDAIGEIEVDRVQIQQVLVNLLQNAADAVVGLEEREVRLIVQAGPSGRIRIMVRDTGPGIATDRLPFLFQPFSTTKQQGLGVGLAISRTIVEAHGGRLEYEPAPGGGSCFSFTLRHRWLEEHYDAA
ncbi:ATP-binding protein [Stakelama marina]|uniref:histidine kinase n=1 Tax=Stakelama marina TaxID=2826939 RepID=A0A8T4I9I3_9SPHN|nr:ATP-binding protein [Stakelama marina]MBR0551003.1 PAS domain-containing protein [Stakelama marina]